MERMQIYQSLVQSQQFLDDFSSSDSERVKKLRDQSAVHMFDAVFELYRTNREAFQQGGVLMLSLTPADDDSVANVFVEKRTKVPIREALPIT